MVCIFFSDQVSEYQPLRCGGWETIHRPWSRLDHHPLLPSEYTMPDLVKISHQFPNFCELSVTP